MFLATANITQSLQNKKAGILIAESAEGLIGLPNSES